MDYKETLKHLTHSNNPVNRLSAMIGATNFISGANGNDISFKFKGSSAANYVKISLNPNDYYDIEFYRIRGLKSTKVKELFDIDAGDLKDIFEQYTNLYLSL